MRFSFFLILSLLGLTLTYGQNKNYKNEAGFKTDNDGFLGTGSDRYYTAGNFLYFNHALKCTDSSNLANKILGFEAGQQIYTPQSAFVPSYYFIDRPFAAYLYIGSTLNLLFKNESNLKLGAKVGVVGPYAFGEQIQDLIHKVFGFYTPSGWEYQVQNDWELNLSAQYNRLLARAHHVDVTLNSYANLGNGQTGAGLGSMLRIGRFNPLYHSVSTQSTISKNISPTPSEVFFYYKPIVNWVAYNATIQGGLFVDRPETTEIIRTPERFVLSQQAGFDFVTNRWVVNLYAIHSGKDATLMVHKSHQWGSVSVLYRFN